MRCTVQLVEDYKGTEQGRQVLRLRYVTQVLAATCLYQSFCQPVLETFSGDDVHPHVTTGQGACPGRAVGGMRW